MAFPSARSKEHSAEQSDALSFYIGRVYYNYIGLLERRLMDLSLGKYVRPGMGSVLFALFQNDSCIIKDICARVQLSPSTLTALLSKMKRAGLVMLRRDNSDGRAVRVTLTPLGRFLEPKCCALLSGIEATLQEGLSEEEVQNLKRSLSKMIDNIRKSAGTRNASLSKIREVNQ